MCFEVSSSSGGKGAEIWLFFWIRENKRDSKNNCEWIIGLSLPYIKIPLAQFMCHTLFTDYVAEKPVFSTLYAAAECINVFFQV